MQRTFWDYFSQDNTALQNGYGKLSFIFQTELTKDEKVWFLLPEKQQIVNCDKIKTFYVILVGKKTHMSIINHFFTSSYSLQRKIHFFFCVNSIGCTALNPLYIWILLLKMKFLWDIYLDFRSNRKVHFLSQVTKVNFLKEKRKF